jgi:hypothetical protein
MATTRRAGLLVSLAKITMVPLSSGPFTYVVINICLIIVVLIDMNVLMSLLFFCCQHRQKLESFESFWASVHPFLGVLSGDSFK